MRYELDHHELPSHSSQQTTMKKPKKHKKKQKKKPYSILCLSGAAALGFQILQSSSSINSLNLPAMGVTEYFRSSLSLSASSVAPKTSNIVIPPDLSVVLPRGGILYRFGSVLPTISTSPPQRRRRGIEIEFSSSTRDIGDGDSDVPSWVQWDMLWSDYHGAFGQNITATSTDNRDTTKLFIPWRNQSNVRPLFLVVYNCGNETALVRYIEENNGQSTSSGQEIDSDEVFSYPRRELNFRSRMGNSSGLVTLCTQLTAERLHHLEHIAQAWSGPISAVIYVGFRYGMDQDMQRVIQFWDNGREEIRRYIDLHLVYDDKRPWYPSGTDETKFLTQNPYPVNLLRQISIDAARTEWIYLIEADMMPVRNGHDIISDSWEEMLAVYADNGPGTAFIVPLYAVPSRVNSNTLKQLPSSKNVLLGKGKVSSGGSIIQGNLRKKQKDAVLEGTNIPILSVANDARRKDSIAMDYVAWENQASKDNDKVPRFLPFHQSGDKEMICRPPAGFGPQEPYFIAKKAEQPPYNVLFAGMHWDAVAQINDMCNCGFSFYIHP